MKRKFLKLAVSLATTLLLVASPLTCLAENTIETDTAGNYFASGEDVKIDGAVCFAGYGAGMNVSASDVVSEDGMALAGMKVSLDSSYVGGTTYLAGQSVTISDSTIEGNIMAAGSEISIDSGCSSNSVTAVGNTITYEGESKGASFAGNIVKFNGTVNGDLVLEGDTIIIGENAVVTGNVSVKSATEPQVKEGASLGNLNFEKIEEAKEKTEEIVSASIGLKILSKIKSALYGALAMAIVGLVMCWLMKDQLEGANEMVKTRTGIMLGTGAITIVAAPLAIILGLITIIGIPVTLLATTILIVLCCIAVAFAGASLGRLVFKTMNPVLASVVSIAILEVVKQIPIIGSILSLAAVIYTVGYFVQTIYLNRIAKKNAVVEVEALPQND